MTAQCHPERRVKAKGLCISCYYKQSYQQRTEKRAAYLQAWRSSEARRIYEAEYRKKNRDVLIARCKSSRLKNVDKYRAANRARTLKRNYGLSIADYDNLLMKQNGVCAVCQRPESNTDKRWGKVRCLAVDHDHETKRVRGLLCARCNVVLGAVKDDLHLMLALARYLAKFTDG